MTLLIRSGGRLPSKALVLALGACVVSVSQVGAFADGPAVASQPCQSCGKVHPQYSGIWGLGKARQSAGFYGFGLGYHPGYGYGGDAMGVHPDGGYPFYGGPGYPLCDPVLRRCGRITPFPYNGGPGYPTPAQPNVFGGPIGPLVPDQPVVTFAGGPFEAGISGGYGGFTGGVPNAEALFAPSTSAAAATGTSGGVMPPFPSPPYSNATPVPGSDPSQATTSPTRNAAPSESVHARSLGIEQEPARDTGGVPGIKVAKVYPGSSAEKAGLHPGDLINSINGYLTTQPGNLAWIIANAAPEKVLVMNVRTASDNKEHTIRAQLP